MSSQSSGPTLHARRKMRKGTASCVECRRRKVRCIIDPGVQACQACILHDRRCTDQEYGISKAEVARKRKTVQKKKCELGGLIEDMLQRLPSDGSKLELKAIEILKKLQSEIPPAEGGQLALIESDATESVTAEQTTGPWANLDGFGKVLQSNIESLNKHDETDLQAYDTNVGGVAHAVRAMKSAAPNASELTLLLEAGQSVWKVWEIAFPEARREHHDGTRKVSIETLHSLVSGILESNNAIGIAKVLLCSALCIQQLASTFDASKTSLPLTFESLQKKWLTPVENLLSQDERSACTIDGLQCMILQTRIYIILGLPYRAWFVFRRAIGYAHLQKLDQQPLYLADSVPRSRQQIIWQQLWTGERFLALLLGLPFSTGNIANDTQIPRIGQGQSSNSKDFLSALGIVAGMVIARDQRQAMIDFSLTMDIEEDLQKCREYMSQDWWDTTPGSEMSLNAIADMFIAKFTYHNVRRQLHLPLMLRSEENSKFQFNREAALQASREMIKLYRIMRDVDRPVLTVCNLADFQVFLAVLVLILDLLSWSSQLDSWMRADQLESDWTLVANVTEDLRRVSRDFPSGVAMQVVHTLEDLYSMRFSTAHNKDTVYQTIVPYFGKITIKAMSHSSPISREEAPESTISGTSIGNHFDEEHFIFDTHLIMPEYCSPLADTIGMSDFNLCDDWSLFLNNDNIL